MGYVTAIGFLASTSKLSLFGCLSIANTEFARDSSKIHILAKDVGLTVDGSRAQMADFQFPYVEEQLNVYFSEDGRAVRLLPFMGKMFATDEFPAKNDYSTVVDTSFLK